MCSLARTLAVVSPYPEPVHIFQVPDCGGLSFSGGRSSAPGTDLRMEDTAPAGGAAAPGLMGVHAEEERRPPGFQPRMAAAAPQALGVDSGGGGVYVCVCVALAVKGGRPPVLEAGLASLHAPV